MPFQEKTFRYYNETRWYYHYAEESINNDFERENVKSMNSAPHAREPFNIDFMFQSMPDVKSLKYFSNLSTGTFIIGIGVAYVERSLQRWGCATGRVNWDSRVEIICHRRGVSGLLYEGKGPRRPPTRLGYNYTNFVLVSIRYMGVTR
jgi:hypothetical protein